MVSYTATNEVFQREDQLVGKFSGFKYLLAGKYDVDEDAGDNWKPYIRGFADIYGLFSDGYSNETIDIAWDGTDAGDIKYFKNIVGFNTNDQAGINNPQTKLVEDPADATSYIINENYPSYLGGSISYFQSITGVTDTFYRGSITNFKDISLSYFDQTLKRDITTAEFTKTKSSIFNSLLSLGDSNTSTLDLYSGKSKRRNFKLGF